MSKKLAVCVPYRNRKVHLKRFVPYLTNFLSENKINHKIFICHQKDKKLFNRGKTKNIAFKIAKEEGYDYFAFHDIDLLPEDNSCDYSYPGVNPVLLSVYLSDNHYRPVPPNYFGGCVLFTGEQFEKINGYYNDYWGWGWEDEDLLYRSFCKNFTRNQYLPVNRVDKHVLSLNGRNSYLKIHANMSGKVSHNKGYTLFMLFKVEEKDNHKFLIGDRYGYFSVPVFSVKNQIEIIFDQFETCTVILKNREGKKYFLSAKCVKNEWFMLAATIDTQKREVRMYINGIEAGQEINETGGPVIYKGELDDFPDNPIFIGTKNEDAGSFMEESFCKGQVGEIALWNRAFSKQEVNNLSADINNLPNPDDLIFHYDFEKMNNHQAADKSKNNIPAQINNCVVLKTTIHRIPVRNEPFRRSGRFRCLPHKKEDFIRQLFGNNVKQSKEAAINERIFRVEVKTGIINPDTNGLNNLDFKLINKEKIFNNHVMINVEC